MPFLEFGSKVNYANSTTSHQDFLRTVCGVDLDGSLQENERAEIVAFSSLISTSLVDALLYVQWLEEENIDVAAQSFLVGLPWPVQKVLCWVKRRTVKSLLEAKHGSKLMSAKVSDGHFFNCFVLQFI